MRKKLIVSDLSNIEGRLGAWLAGEEWKLQAFRDYDAGTGPDLYNVTATSIIGGDPWTLEKYLRNVFGKVPDLSGLYQGGNGAFDTFEKAYGVNLLDYWPLIQKTADPDILQRAHDNWADWGGRKDPETDRTLWIAREVCKLSWRTRHPATVALWYAIQDAIRYAMDRPGTIHKAGPRLLVGRVTHQSDDWLLVKLPSGKYLTYLHPRYDSEGGLLYDGYVQTGTGGRVWGTNYTYGGKILENACQALGGDIIKATMPAIEAAGYAVVLTVHDEDVTEAPDTPEYNAEHLSELLATVPAWADGLPLAAAGFESYRYKKED